MADVHPNAEGVTEQSPLLRSTSRQDEVTNASTSAKKKSWQTSQQRVTLLFMLVVLLSSLGDQWMDSPQTRIIEAVICYRHYEKVDPSKILIPREAIGPGAVGGVAEMWCKTADVQNDLAMLRGWQQLFDGIPSLLLAVPLGWAADRYGRKPVMLAGFTGFALKSAWIQIVTWFFEEFDVRMTWLSTIFFSIGGGGVFTSTMAFVVLSDITPEAQRAGVFLRVAAFNLLANLIMPPLAAVLMPINPWIPSLGGTVLEVLAVVLLAFCPETLRYRRPSLLQRKSTARGLARTNSRQVLQKPNFVRRWAATFNKSMDILTNDWRVPVLLLPFLFHQLAGANIQLVLQYLSKRYTITLAEATLLMTIRNVVVVVLMFIIIPYASTMIMRTFQLSAQRKDLYLVRASQIFVAVGWTLVAFSPNIPFVAVSLAIASLGQGAAVILRSFLTSFLPSHHIARVYSIASVVDTLGAMFGSPILAALFMKGLELGGSWIGLPFYFFGLISAAFAVLLFFIGLHEGEDEEDPVDEDH